MLFDDSESSLNLNDNSFLTNSSETTSAPKVNKPINSKKTSRHVVNHFFAPSKRLDHLNTRNKAKNDVDKISNLISIEELTSQKTENSVKISNRINSKSVHFTSPLAISSSHSNSPIVPKLPVTPKTSIIDSAFFRPPLSKSKYTNLAPLTKIDVIRSSSFRNNTNSRVYFSNANSLSGKIDETKSLENIKDQSKDGFVTPNTHSINRLIKMATNWNIKSRSSSTSSSYIDPNLFSQSKIKQTQMFLSDENEYATIESSLSRQLAEYMEKGHRINLLEDLSDINSRVLPKKRNKSPTRFVHLPLDTSSQRSSAMDDAILPKVETNFINSQNRPFNKNRLARSFRLVSIDKNNTNSNKSYTNKNEQKVATYKQTNSQLPIQINF